MSCHLNLRLLYGAVVFSGLFLISSSVIIFDASCAVGGSAASACKASGMADVCKAAYERYENDGIYQADASLSVHLTAKSGGLGCGAQFQCDSSGPGQELSGATLKGLFASIQSNCGSCGQKSTSASNCWVSLFGCQNCDPQDIGGLSGESGGSGGSSVKSSISTKPSSPTYPIESTKTTYPIESTKTTYSMESTKTTYSMESTKTTYSMESTPSTDAQKSVNDAKSSVDSYLNDPTNASLAQNAKDAIEKALNCKHSTSSSLETKYF
jgi:hypothetical protein